MTTTDRGAPAPAESDDRGRLSSRRQLLGLGLGVAAGSAAMLTTLDSPPAGATTAGVVHIATVTTTTATTPTALAYTHSGTEQGGVLRASLQDWGGQVFNVRAYGAAGDGVTLDTSAIARAQAAAGTGCVYFPPGTYLTKGISVSTAGQTVKIESGATLLATTTISKPVITVTAGGVSILGPGAINGGATTITPVAGLDGIKFSPGGDDGRVEGVLIQNAASIGIAGIGANRTHVSLSRVVTCNQSGISFATSTAPITGPLILGNTVRSTGSKVTTGINVSGGSSPTNTVNNPTVVANTVDLVAGIGFQLSECQYARVVGNRASTPSQVFSVVAGTDNVVSANTALALGNGAGIEFGSNFSICTANTIQVSPTTGTGAGIHVDNGAGTNVVISNNKVTGARKSGIGIGSYNHITVTGNTVTQSPTATAAFAAIQVSPTAPGLVVISDNVCDGSGKTQFGIWLSNVVGTSSTPTAAAAKTSVHDNVIFHFTSTALHLSGSGTVTDLVVHDNSVSSGIPLYTKVTGLTFGANVFFHDNTLVGGTFIGVTPVTLPASGVPYTNPGPYVEVLYVWGGTLKTTGANQGIMKGRYSIAPASIKLTVPIAITLYPRESVTVYYSAAPTARKDVKGLTN